MSSRLQPHQLAAYKAAQDRHEDMTKFVMPPPIRRPRNNEESVMQRALIKWWQANCRHFNVPELCLLSIPNGGNGDARRGSIMKAEGQRKGAPDLFLSVRGKKYSKNPNLPAGSTAESIDRMKSEMVVFYGLFLELKTPSGRLSPEQEVYHEILARQGYRVAVCRTLAECIDTITTYLT